MTSGNAGEYHLGFAMSGAISAGAYTAGVLDFFVQALDEWESQRGQSGTPAHRTGIKVIAGASAGAMTGALGAISLARQQEPVLFARPQEGKQACERYLPSLYETWVERPDMLPKQGWPGFLSGEDLDKRTPEGKRCAVVSALNSVLLDRIRDSVLAQHGEPQKRPYIADPLHIYMTITNTRGIPYRIAFDGGVYTMMLHSDRAHYEVRGLGTWRSVSAFGSADASRALDVSDLFRPAGPGEGWKQYANHALASGAFPVGLSARPVESTLGDYASRQWPVQQAFDYSHAIEPAWPARWQDADGASFDAQRAYNFVAVDGGVFNNDPMEFASFALRANVKDPNDRGELADRAVIMITPFPEAPDFAMNDELDLTLTNVLSTLFPAFKNQARFKLPELILASENTVHSRYMITPVRRLRDGDGDVETYSLACGLLEGFGGFFSKKLRDHDFQLGRRNCQRFLSNHFRLSAGNRIVQAYRAGGQAPHLGPDGSLPVIPLVGSAAGQVPQPKWAQMTLKEVDTILPLLLKRIERVSRRLILSHFASRWLRWAVWLAKHLANQSHRAPYYLRWTVLSELIQRNQIAEWTPPADWKFAQPSQISAVWAALANPSWHYRTAAALENATGVPEATVLKILEKCEAAKDKEYRVVRAPYRWGPRYYYGFKEKTKALSFAHWIPLVRQIYTIFGQPLKLDNSVPRKKAQPCVA